MFCAGYIHSWMCVAVGKGFMTISRVHCPSGKKSEHTHRHTNWCTSTSRLQPWHQRRYVLWSGYPAIRTSSKLDSAAGSNQLQRGHERCLVKHVKPTVDNLWGKQSSVDIDHKGLWLGPRARFAGFTRFWVMWEWIKTIQNHSKPFKTYIIPYFCWSFLGLFLWWWTFDPSIRDFFVLKTGNSRGAKACTTSWPCALQLLHDLRLRQIASNALMMSSCLRACVGDPGDPGDLVMHSKSPKKMEVSIGEVMELNGGIVNFNVWLPNLDDYP